MARYTTNIVDRILDATIGMAEKPSGQACEEAIVDVVASHTSRNPLADAAMAFDVYYDHGDEEGTLDRIEEATRVEEHRIEQWLNDDPRVEEMEKKYNVEITFTLDWEGEGFYLHAAIDRLDVEEDEEDDEDDEELETAANQGSLPGEGVPEEEIEEDPVAEEDYDDNEENEEEPA